MKKIRVLILGFTFVLLCTFAASYAQKESQSIGPTPPQSDSPNPDREQALRNKLDSLLSPVGVSVGNSLQSIQVEGYRQVQVRWNAYEGSADVINPMEQQSALNPEMRLLGERKEKGGLPKQRTLELSTEQILVVAVDSKQQLKAWTLIADPRILRAELPDAKGKLSKHLLHYSKPQFSVAFPDMPEIKELRFYAPNWTGTEITLVLIGSVAV
jgi:hypothetical protein